MHSDDSNASWRELWNERGRAIRDTLGESTPSGSVFPFEWTDRSLPGACAIVFAPTQKRPDWMTMSLGLSQPLTREEKAGRWEYCVRSARNEPWVRQIIYDLLTFHLQEDGQVTRGMYLPIVFFKDRVDELCAGLSPEREGLNVVGEMCGIYLWDDSEGIEFRVSTGTFHLMTAIGVTHDEDLLAQATTPPHLLLLLAEMGVSQRMDPLRQCVLKSPGAMTKWRMIQGMHHDDVVSRLGQRLGRRPQ